MSTERVVDSLNAFDESYEPPLRPISLADFKGQSRLKDQLDIMLKASKIRGSTLDHLLFCGPPGLGKTTLAHIVAHALGKPIKTTSGPVIDKAADLAGILTSLEEGDVLFIDEIHRLNHVVEEYLYSAMEDKVIDILIDKGPSARSIKIELNSFTLVGATTRSGLLSSPLRSRFGMIFHLHFYEVHDLRDIIVRSSSILDVDIDPEGALEIAKRSRGTARIANNLLKRVSDYALVNGNSKVTHDVANAALSLLDVDCLGLDEMDKKILNLMIESYGGGPVGLSTLAVAVGEEEDTISEVYEPYLIQAGLVKRTAQGRVATERAWTHLGFQRMGELPF